MYALGAILSETANWADIWVARKIESTEYQREMPGVQLSEHFHRNPICLFRAWSKNSYHTVFLFRGYFMLQKVHMSIPQEILEQANSQGSVISNLCAAKPANRRGKIMDQAIRDAANRPSSSKNLLLENLKVLEARDFRNAPGSEIVLEDKEGLFGGAGLTIYQENQPFSREHVEKAGQSVFSDDALLPGLKNDLDHDAPRGKSRYPALIETSGKTAAGIALDLSRLATLPLLPVKGAVTLGRMGYNRWSRQVDNLTPEQRKLADQKAKNLKARQLMEGLIQRTNLQEILDEEGTPIDPIEIKARVYFALRQKPAFMETAADALSHPLTAALKWPLKAKPEPQRVVQILANADFGKSDASMRAADLTAEPEGGEREEEKNEASYKKQLMEQVVDRFKEAAKTAKFRREKNVRRFFNNTVTGRAAKLELDVGPSEAETMCRDMRISGSLFTHGSRALANGLRANSKFQLHPISQEEFQKHLEKGKLPPTKNPYRLMTLEPHGDDEKLTIHKASLTEHIGRALGRERTPGIEAILPKMRVSSTDPNAKLLLAVLLKGQEASLMEAGIEIRPHTLLAMKVRDTKFFKQNVLEPLVDTFRLTEQITLKNHKQVNLKESCMWPFLESVILHGSKELGPNCYIEGTNENCFDRLAQSDVYQFESDDKGLEQFLNDRMQSTDPEIADLKVRLAAVQAASLHYAEQVEIQETVESFLKGAIVGVTGEAVVENTLGHSAHDVNLFTQPNFWANVALLGLVDAYDNWQGEQGALEADLKGMGLKNIPEHVFGEKPDLAEGHKSPFLENAREYAKLLIKGDADGPAAQSVANAYRSALLGALGGALASLGSAQPFSRENSSIPMLMGASAVATLGTALSIPINFALTLPRVMATYNEHLQAGRLKLPAHVDAQNEQAVFNHVRETAIQEMMARVGLQASAKAYTVVPLLSMAWLPNINNLVPRKVIQPTVFGVTPAAENLTRMGLTMDRLNRAFPEAINQAERMILASKLSEKENAAEYQEELRREFSDRWSQFTAKAMDYVTYLILQMPLTYRRHINYVLQRPAGDELV